MYLGIAIEVWVIAGLMVLAILFLMSMLARLYRKAGPHEALIVYGFRGTRVVQGHGTVIFPTGATPTMGERVALVGYYSSGTFIANRVILHP